MISCHVSTQGKSTSVLIRCSPLILLCSPVLQAAHHALMLSPILRLVSHLAPTRTRLAAENACCHPDGAHVAAIRRMYARLPGAYGLHQNFVPSKHQNQILNTPTMSFLLALMTSFLVAPSVVYSDRPVGFRDTMTTP